MWAGQALRYVLAGGFNTAVTYLAYLALLPQLGYRASYLLAFLLGIGLSFFLLRRWVFARPGKPFSWIYVGLSHGAQLLLGWLVIEVWVAGLQQSQRLAPLVAIAVCVPLMFMAQRWIFSPDASS